LSGSKPFEALGEGPRAAGIDPTKRAARDAQTVVHPIAFRAGFFLEALGEGPRVAGIDPTKRAARDAQTVVHPIALGAIE